MKEHIALADLSDNIDNLFLADLFLFGSLMKSYLLGTHVRSTAGPITQTAALTAGTVTNGTLVGLSLVAAMGDGLDTTYMQSGAGSSSGVPYSTSDISDVQFASPAILSDVKSFVANIRCSVATGTAQIQLQVSGGLSGASASAVNVTATTTIATLQTLPITKTSGTWTPAQLAAATFEVIATVSGSAPDIFIYEISLTATQ